MSTKLFVQTCLRRQDNARLFGGRSIRKIEKPKLIEAVMQKNPDLKLDIRRPSVNQTKSPSLQQDLGIDPNFRQAV